MNQHRWIGWVVGTALVGSGLLAPPATAQTNQSDITGGNVWTNPVPTNQSDITGGNIFNNIAPLFDEDGALDPEILSEARRLSQALDAAAARCCDAAAPVGPRRFARGPGDPNAVCNSPDCPEFNRLVEETRVFLGDVNRSPRSTSQSDSEPDVVNVSIVEFD